VKYKFINRSKDMKLQITMKDPDALRDCIEDVLRDLLIDGVSEYEMKQIRETRLEEIKDMAIRKWFNWGEYLNAEIDTDKETCLVLERKD
jgi:hypothetical protein